MKRSAICGANFTDAPLCSQDFHKMLALANIRANVRLSAMAAAKAAAEAAAATVCIKE